VPFTPARARRGPQARRARLRRLDDCLNVLEQAHEQGLKRVTATIADTVRAYAPAVRPGMSIVLAHEAVLCEQAPYKRTVSLPEDELIEPPTSSPGGSPGDPSDGRGEYVSTEKAGQS
jgi:hypothetical protein